MKLTSREQRGANSLLKRYSKQRRGPHFVHMIARNLLIVKPFIKALDEQEAKRSDTYIEYDEKRMDACKKYADKGSSGEPLMNFSRDGRPTSYKITKNTEEFNEVVDALKKEYKEALEEEEERKKDFEEFLDSEEGSEDIKFRTLALNRIPMIYDEENPENSELVVTPGDLMLFLEYGIITDNEEEGEEEEDNVVPAKFPNKVSSKSSSKKQKSKKKRRV